MAKKKKAKGKTRAKRKKLTKVKRRKTAKARRKPAKKTLGRSRRKAASTAAVGTRSAVAPKPAAPTPPGQRIGVVTHYFSHLSVATLRLDPGATLRIGDVIHILGHTTDFRQKIESLEVDHAPVTEVGPNDDFGLKVVDHAREHDVVYKVRS
jgi:putative protease